MAGLNDFLKQPPRLSARWRADVGDHVIGVAWSPDGKLVAAAAIGGPIAVFDANTGKPSVTLSGHDFGTMGVQFRDGKTLASVGQDGKARIWDAVSGEAIATMDGGAAWVEHLAWSAKGDYLATAAGKKLRLFDHAGNLVREYPDQPATISGLSWRPVGGELTSSCYGKVVTWSPNADKPVKELAWRGSVLSHAWAPSGKHLATGDQDATVHYWVYATGHHLQMRGYPSKVRELSWDTTSQWLATGGGWMASVWDCGGVGPERREPVMLDAQPEGERVTVLAYQAVGPHLATGGSDGKLAVWRPDKSPRVLSSAKLDAEVSRAAWSPGDTKLAVGTARGEVVLFGV